MLNEKRDPALSLLFLFILKKNKREHQKLIFIPTYDIFNMNTFLGRESVKNVRDAFFNAVKYNAPVKIEYY